MIKDHTERDAKFVNEKYDRFGKQFLQVCINSKMAWVAGERCVFRLSFAVATRRVFDSTVGQTSATKAEARPHQSSSFARFKPARNFKPGKPITPAASVDIDLS